MPATPVYATAQDVLDYVQVSDLDQSDIPEDEDTLEGLIIRAERDVDDAAGSWPVDPDTGRKFDPADPLLTVAQVDALREATCAQTEYRLLQGETWMAKSQHQAVRIETDQSAEFRAGQLPYIGRKTLQALSAAGLVRADLGVL